MAARDLEVAQFMMDKLNISGRLYQEVVIYDIIKNFGGEYYYSNVNGNPAISKSVLKQFRALSGDNVIWERGDRCWRKRMRHDAKGKRGQD